MDHHGLFHRPSRPSLQAFPPAFYFATRHLAWPHLLQSNIRFADDEVRIIIARSKVYAGNLSYKSTSEDLKNLFTPVGGEM